MRSSFLRLLCAALTPLTALVITPVTNYFGVPVKKTEANFGAQKLHHPTC